MIKRLIFDVDGTLITGVNFVEAINNTLKKLNVYLEEKIFAQRLFKYFFEELKTVIPSKNESLIKTINELSNKYELVLLINYFSESQLNRLNNMGIGHFFY